MDNYATISFKVAFYIVAKNLQLKKLVNYFKPNNYKHKNEVNPNQKPGEGDDPGEINIEKFVEKMNKVNSTRFDL